MAQRHPARYEARCTSPDVLRLTRPRRARPDRSPANRRTPAGRARCIDQDGGLVVPRPPGRFSGYGAPEFDLEMGFICVVLASSCFRPSSFS